jgi:hypothetical protein
MEAEKSGHDRGMIDLSACYDMLEVFVARKYGFKLRVSSECLLQLNIGLSCYQSILQILNNSYNDLIIMSILEIENKKLN